MLNDLYREADRVGVPLEGVRVDAAGGFDTQTWQSLGIRYAVQVDSPAPAEELARLVALVDDVAEVPRALRAGADVRRVEAGRR